jgi:hypothetical protein
MTRYGTMVALDVTCTLADSDPVAVGENAAVKLQFPPTATVPGQLFVRT